MSQSEKPAGPGAFVTEAYNTKSQEELLSFYRKWAEEYDDQMAALNYISPQSIAAVLKKHLEDASAGILDVGCGTGLTAKYMHLDGYSNLHGIDVSPDMVAVSGQRDIYSSLQVGDVTQPLNYPDHAFDAGISSGTFTHGHVGPEALDEIFRVLKPSGVLACTVHNDLWQNRGFDVKFQQLEDTGLIRCLSREQGRYYEDSEPEGWFCAYRKR